MQQSIYGKNKEYLSYSAIDLWRKSPAQYRKRYYDLVKTPDTIYTGYGREIHKDIEEGRILLDSFPRERNTSEVQIRCTIDGVDMLAYIDILNLKTYTFADIKSSKNEWNAVRVQKLDQLPVYSLLIQKHYGEVQSRCAVVWVETEKTEDRADPLLPCAVVAGGMQRTGRIETLWRTIDQDERDRWRTIIKQVAHDITNDYKQYI